MQIIGQGAQATVYKVTLQDGNFKVIKQRLPKTYRHPQLDKKLNQSRIKSQCKIIQKLYKKGLKVPKLYSLSLQQYKIQMQYLHGTKLKTYLNDLINKKDIKQIGQIMHKLGKIVARIHQLGVIHGDLTTSNMIYYQNQIYIIDFGLSYVKTSIEDKAVDLYVLERAFISTHPQLQQQFHNVLIAYNDQPVLKRLEVVRQRGRKKIAFG